MRHSTARRLARIAAVAVIASGASTASAAISAFFSPVTIPQAAIDDDPLLATTQCWDIMVTCDGNWASAGMEATLPTFYSFYNHPLGGNTKPHPGIVSAFPSLAFDTYVTAPADTGSGGAPTILGGFPDGQTLSMSGNRLSVSWGDLVNDPPGTYQIARLTFPLATLPLFHEASSTSQVSPDSTALLAPLGPAPARWIHDGDGSWHDGANWDIGAPPSGNVVVTIDVSGPIVRTITHSQGARTVHTIDAQEHLLLAGGTISVINQGITVANGLTISGGALRGPLVVSGSPVTIGAGGGYVENVGYADGLIPPDRQRATGGARRDEADRYRNVQPGRCRAV